MATQSDLDSIINYYVNLLIIQYHNKTNAQATITALMEQVVANGVYFDVIDGYNVDTAVGVQLDIIGKYVGVDRYFTGQDFTDFFAFIEYDTDPAYGLDGRIGFCDYSDIGVKTGKWLTYDDIVSNTYSLPDDEFRKLIKLKILSNNSNYSDKEIDDGLFAIFGYAVSAVDNYDMSMTYIVDTSVKALVDVAYTKGLLPKPMGVRIEEIVSVSFVTTPDGDIITTPGGSPIYVEI